ncbi:hypothetical protein ACVXZZ_00875 [Staphylococcus aureus]
MFLDAYQKVFDINTEQIVHKYIMKLAPYLQSGENITILCFVNFRYCIFWALDLASQMAKIIKIF